MTVYVPGLGDEIVTVQVAVMLLFEYVGAAQVLEVVAGATTAGVIAGTMSIEAGVTPPRALAVIVNVCGVPTTLVAEVAIETFALQVLMSPSA